MHEEIVNLHKHFDKRKEFSFHWETYKYVNEIVNGEIEVVDVCTETVVNMSVPVLTFIEFIDLILFCNAKGYAEHHYFTSFINPLYNEGKESHIWLYFDKKKDHILYNKTNPPEIMAIYYLAEFEKFIVMRIENRK